MPRLERCWAYGLGKCWPATTILTGQHWPKRSQGGKRVVARLCPGHHDAIDNGFKYHGRRLGNRVDGENYVIFDRRTKEELVCRPALKGGEA